MRVDRTGLKKKVRSLVKHEDEDLDFTKELEGSALEWVRSEIQRGNSWAWCAVQVTVWYQGISSQQYLGACSYQSEAEFLSGGYYEQLVDDGVEEIATTLEGILLDHGLWTHDPTLCVWCVAAS